MLLPFHFFTLKLTEFLVEYSFPDKNHSSCKSVDHKTRKQLYKKKKIRTGHKVLNLLIAFPTPFLAHRASKGLMGKFTELPIGIFPLTICPCIFFLSIYQNVHNSKKKIMFVQSMIRFINRPGVAGAVLQSPSSLVKTLMICENIFKTPSLPNHKS